jgi:hypothetical protein
MQLRSPGVWRLSVAPGRSAEVFEPLPDSAEVALIDSFYGSVLPLHVRPDLQTSVVLPPPLTDKA